MGSADVEILDISSDEDDLVKVKSKLPSAERVSEDLGAHGVLVVDELSCNAVALEWRARIDDPHDDDCVVLDGDPDKAVAVVQEKGAESDDLQIVGEKGQLACRDYPHPRHLCAAFPFNCTPHEKHCIQCHCYVCDSLAPCIRWGNGSSLMDHCHASDKEHKWTEQRQFMKNRNLVGQPEMRAPSELDSGVPSVFIPSPMQHTNNSAEKTHSGNNAMPPLTQPPRAGPPYSRTPNLMAPCSNQPRATPIYAMKGPPASRVIQKERRGGSIPPYFRPAHPSYKRSPAQFNVPGHGQSTALPRSYGYPTYPMVPSMDQQFPVAVPSSARIIPREVLPQRNYRTTVPHIHRNYTATMPPNQQAVQGPRNFWPRANIATEVDVARLNEIIAGLESELGLPHENHAAVFHHSSGSFQPHTTHFPHDTGNQTSQAYSPLSVNVDANQSQIAPGIHASVPGPGSSLLGRAPQNVAGHGSVVVSQPPQIQPTTASLGSPNDRSGVESIALQSRVHFLEPPVPSLAVLKDPGVLPPDPPNLLFDFEDSWHGL